MDEDVYVLVQKIVRCEYLNKRGILTEYIHESGKPLAPYSAQKEHWRKFLRFPVAKVVKRRDLVRCLVPQTCTNPWRIDGLRILESAMKATMQSIAIQ
jgi:hypothetical protein